MVVDNEGAHCNHEEYKNDEKGVRHGGGTRLAARVRGRRGLGLGVALKVFDVNDALAGVGVWVAVVAANVLLKVYRFVKLDPC